MNVMVSAEELPLFRALLLLPAPRRQVAVELDECSHAFAHTRLHTQLFASFCAVKQSRPSGLSKLFTAGIARKQAEN